MKLEIKHLAPYLPYGLNMIFEKSGRVITMQSCFTNGALNIVDYKEGNTYNLTIWNFKPILRPLEDYTVYEFITNEMSERDIEHLDSLLAMKLMPVGGYVNWLNYGAVQAMLEANIDFMGLIDAGLAIDKNTLDK